jgi:hypothetical protein
LIYLQAVWTDQNELPAALSKEYGDVNDASATGERGGRNKVQPLLKKMEAHFLAGPQSAVLLVLTANRFAKESVFGLLPRALAVWMMQTYVWNSRFKAVWAKACAALAEPKRKEKKKGSANKKRHPKKEKKPGTGIKGFMMGI